jgi:hypothetical protein
MGPQVGKDAAHCLDAAHVVMVWCLV